MQTPRLKHCLVCALSRQLGRTHHSTTHRAQLTSEFTCARETTVILKLRLKATFDFGTLSAPLRAPQAERQMQETKRTLWPRDEIELSVVHTVSKCASSSVKDSTTFRRCSSRRMKPHAKEAAGPATAAREAGPAAACTLTLQSTAAAVDVDHVLKLSTGRQKKSQVR